jgi:RHS repeat-associated protein
VFELTDMNTGTSIAADVQLEETAPNRPFSSVLRLVTDGAWGGSVSLLLKPETVADEWGNGNATLTVTLSPGPPGTVLYEQSNPSGGGPGRLARSSIDSPFLFHGQYFDYDAGIIYMRARFYDPFTGQFFQRDPLGYNDSVNLYAGMGNNPVSFRDPSGAVRIRITTNRARGQVVPIPSRVPRGGRRRPDPSEVHPTVTSRTRPARTSRPEEASIQVDMKQLYGRTGRTGSGRPPLKKDPNQAASPGPSSARGAAGREGGEPRYLAVETEEGIRPVVVVQTSRGPQAFYRSTGENSALPNQWLPFEGIDHKLGYIGDVRTFPKEGFFQTKGDLMFNKGAFATGRQGDPLRRFGDPDLVPESFSRELRTISQRLGQDASLNNLQNYKVLNGIGADQFESAGRAINRHLFERGARVRPDFDYYIFNALPRSTP